MDEPDAICFVVCENHHEKHGDKTMWRIMVDMKSKTLRSVFRYTEGWRYSSRWDRHFPSGISKYFNSKPSTGQPPGPAAQAEAMQNLMSSRIKNKVQAIDDTTQAASPEAAILAALQEIPGLDRDDMMKAYRILTHDDSGRRLRSLMGLPMDLRKDWVLMEIKASEACVLCSACSADLQCN
jgi:hypothetical protein